MEKEKPKYSKNWITRTFDHKMWFYDFAKVTGALPVVLFFRLKRLYIDGKKPRGLYKGKYISYSNHVGFSDPVIIQNTFATRRTCIVATDELFNTKFKKLFFNLIAAIPVNTEHPQASTFKNLKKKLERGHVAHIFPEGHIEQEEKLTEFKSGVIVMANMNDAEIMPIYIAKRTKWYHRQIIVTGNKINPNDYIPKRHASKEEIKDLSLKLMSIEKTLEEKCMEYIKKHYTNKKGEIVY